MVRSFLLISKIFSTLSSKIDTLFEQQFQENPFWQRDILTSPSEKGDLRGIFKSVREIPPDPPLIKGGYSVIPEESGIT
jgi:hypothetical protein